MVVRRLFREANQISNFKEFSQRASSALMKLECLRTIDRARLSGRMNSDEVAEKLNGFRIVALSVIFFDIDETIINEASEPRSLPLGSLDAIHLATARLWRDEIGENIFFLTHDRALAQAAAVLGFEVRGC